MPGPTPGTRQPGLAPQTLPSDVRAAAVPGAGANDDTCEAGGSGRLRRLLVWSRLGCTVRELLGARTAVAAPSARSVAMRSAVLPRTHPPQAKPRIMIPNAPTTTPQHAGFSHCGTCMSHLLVR